MKPSYFALSLSGFLVGLAIFLLLWQILVKKENVSDIMSTTVLILLFSIAISLHGVLHLWAEIYYDFNPLETGKFYY